MYAYTHDPETGGLLLTNTLSDKSNEPRPVYAKELDILGIGQYWKYKKQNDVPYMWAEANKYYYRGDVIFTLSGGSLYDEPEVVISYKKDENNEPTDIPVLKVKTRLEPVDMDRMLEKNKEILSTLEQITTKDIYSVYRRYQKKVDCFYVAFSGGKDSVVLLDLVKKALPKSSYFVMFGDTQMEFPDTYDIIEKIERDCKNDKIEFYRASSHLTPQESWNIFGPPSRALRWCCSVHKSVPQVLTIRKITGEVDYIGLAFVGVRALESATRAKYTKVSYGGKQSGQYSHNSILDWNSAEIWLYVFAHNLYVNEAYRGGANRVGCLLCPMGGGKGDYIQYKLYKYEIDKFIELILSSVSHDQQNFHKDSYISHGGWNARKNGRFLSNNELKIHERGTQSTLEIKLHTPYSSPYEWEKILSLSQYHPVCKKDGDDYTIKINKSKVNSTELFNLRKLYRKAAYCVSCRMCEANCRNHSITFDGGLKIDGCLHCGQCQDVDGGCLLYKSRIYSSGKSEDESQNATNSSERVGVRMAINEASINNFSNHAPKPEWIVKFLQEGNSYFIDNTSLGPEQFDNFSKFLTYSGFIIRTKDKKRLVTPTFELFQQYGDDSSLIWGMVLVNLMYQSSQFRWYVNNLEIDKPYTVEEVENEIKAQELTSGKGSVQRAYARICEMQLGKSLNFGTTTSTKRKLETLTRTKCYTPNPLVLLYALYRYAETCGGYHQFTLSTLLDASVESAGVSPVKIFGYTREELRRQIEGLSARYPEFIGCAFTHDLEVVNLRPEMNSGWDLFSKPAPENEEERKAFFDNDDVKKTVLNLFYERS